MAARNREERSRELAKRQERHQQINALIWKPELQQDRYIDLFENVIFKRKLLTKTSPTKNFEFKFRKKADCLKNDVLNQHDSYPEMTEAVDITMDPVYGRCLTANRDIPFETKIAETKPYVAVVDCTDEGYCRNCFRDTVPSRSKICHCKTVKFCGRPCQDENETHKYECGTAYHTIEFRTELHLKAAMEMVFKALAIFGGDVDELKRAVEEMRLDDNNNRRQIPRPTRTPLEKFQCVMGLEGKVYAGFERQLFETYSFIMQLPKISALFSSVEDKRFLQHLLAQNLLVIASNSFESELIPDIRMLRLYDVASFFNHSCLPNVLTYLEGGTLHCVASRKIEEGEILCIDYGNFSKEITQDDRQKYLDTGDWCFMCNCLRCQHNQAGEEITKAEIDDALKLDREALKETLRTATPNWDRNVAIRIIAYDQSISNDVR